MTNDFIAQLKDNPDCLYIYNRDFSIYGLEAKERYTIVVKDDWVCPEDFEDYDKEVYEIYRLKDWFNIILTGELIGWECACLNKKYIIKEHVKLLMTTNPLLLRKNIDKKYNELQVSSKIVPLKLWELVKDIKFSMQIIENHKIVNFKEANEDYSAITNIEEPNDLFSYVDTIYQRIKDLTDGMIAKEKMTKLKKKWAK